MDNDIHSLMSRPPFWKTREILALEGESVTLGVDEKLHPKVTFFQLVLRDGKKCYFFSILA